MVLIANQTSNFRSNSLIDLVIYEPWKQSKINFNAALEAKIKIFEPHRFGRPDQNMHRLEELSLQNRVCAFAASIILAIPLLNAVFLCFLKAIGSKFYHAIPPEIIRQEGDISPMALEKLQSAVQEVQRIQRKADELYNLHSSGQPRTPQLDCDNLRKYGYVIPAEILQLKLGECIANLSGNTDAYDLCNHYDWATEGFSGNEDELDLSEGQIISLNKERLRSEISQFMNSSASEGEQPNAYAMTKNTLVYTAEIFNITRATVQTGSSDEELLKKTYRNFIKAVHDSTLNCVDQTLSQMYGAFIEVVATFKIFEQHLTQEEQMQAFIGSQLALIRVYLLKKILVDNDGRDAYTMLEAMLVNNPTMNQNAREEILRRHREAHMAELSVLAMNACADLLGLSGDIFSASIAHCFDSFRLGVHDPRISRAREEFIGGNPSLGDNANINKYDPETFLFINLLQPSVRNPLTDFRNKLIINAKDELELTKAANGNLAEQFLNAISHEGNAEDVTDAILGGGCFSAAGLCYLLEKNGVIKKMGQWN